MNEKLIDDVNEIARMEGFKNWQEGWEKICKKEEKIGDTLGNTNKKEILQEINFWK